MKKEKIVVYSLTFVLFSLMMLAYWLLNLFSWDPIKLGIEILFIFLLARSGGNIVLLYFNKKVSSETISGIMAILFFSALVIRLDRLFGSIVLLCAPIATIMIIYALFKKRSPYVFINVAKILIAGFLACAFYLVVLSMIEKTIRDLSKTTPVSAFLFCF